MSALPPSTLNRIKAAIRATPSPTRQQGRARRRRLFIAAACVLAATAVMRGPGALLSKPLGYTVASALGVGLVAVVLARILRRYETSTLGPRRELLQRANRVAVPGLLIGSVIGNLISLETLRWPAARAMCHLPCAMLLMMSGGLLACFGILVLRRADPLTPRTTATTVGALAGAWTSLAVSLQCALTDPIHVLGTHVLPVAQLMLTTGYFGARFVGLEYREKAEGVARSVPRQDAPR